MPRDAEGSDVLVLPFSAGKQSGEEPGWLILDSTEPEEGVYLPRAYEYVVA